MNRELASEKNQSGQFHFSIDSSLLFQIGEQLVAKPSIALAELVKNAYDADATKVIITMENVEQKGGIIVVEDDGHGMTFEEMEKSWMRIATTTKRDSPISRIYRRPLTGAKGIGRFAARRLGNKLTVQSIAERIDEPKEGVIAEFDWKKDFKPGNDLVEISVTYTRKQVNPGTQTGVTLFIEDVRDAWTEDDLAELRRDLLTIQSPFPDLVARSEVTNKIDYPEDPGFNIEFEIKGIGQIEDLSGGLGEAFLDASWAMLDGHIDKEGCAHYEIRIQKTKEVEQLIDSENKYNGLEEARLRIYFMVYRKDFFTEFDFGVRDAVRKGREEGGVRVYLDGFRVFPYGDVGDDWLELDKASAKNIDIGRQIAPPKTVIEFAASIPGRPFLLIPRNNQLFGAVFLSQTTHTEVEVNISRERLIASPTEAKLRRFVLNGIYWMTLKYAAYRVLEEAKNKPPKPPQTIHEIIDETKQRISALAIPQENSERIIQYLDRVTELVKEQEEERFSEISMLRTLASAGTTIILMNHQLRALITAVLQIKEDLRMLRSQIPPAIHPHYDDIITQITEWHEMVKRQVSQLGFLLAPESRKQRKRHVLRQIVDNMSNPMSYYIKTHNIQFNNNVPPALHTPPIFEAELYSILINLLSNALKAVYDQPHRQIAVEAEKINRTLYIRMMDTGRGLPPEWRNNPDIAFKPFITKSIPNPVLGVGTGLGLKVVKDILEQYAGEARFVEVDQPWATCIEIELPERGEL